MTTRTLAILAALAALAAAAPADAAPKKPRTWAYSVTVKGKAAFTYGWAQPLADGKFATGTEDLGFEWSTRIKRAVLGEKDVRSSTAAPTRITRVNAESAQTLPLPGTEAWASCTGNTASAGRSILATPLLTSLTKHVDIALRQFYGGIHAETTCTGNMGPVGAIAVNNVEAAATLEEPLTLEFQIPHEALGSGKIIELFDEDMGCPQPPDQFRTACSMRLKGEMVLRKLRRSRK